MVLSPGPAPVTELQVTTMVESANEFQLHPKDVRDLGKKSIPIVLAYNGYCHYCPTKPLQPKEFTQTQIKSLGKLCNASLDVISNIDIEMLDKTNKSKISTLRAAIRYFTGKTPAKNVKSPNLPALARPIIVSSSDQEEDVDIPSAAGPSRPITVSSSEAEQEDSSSQVPTTKKSGNEKQHICHICGKSKTRHSDLLDHLAVQHQIGSPRLCATCNKTFSSKRSLKQHKRNQHDKVYRFACDRCSYETDYQKYLDSHTVKYHEAQSAQIYKCDLCKKIFDGEHLLKRHKRHNMCQVKKKYPCTNCTIRFKLRSALEIHIKTYHTGEIDMLKCPKCDKELGTKAGMKSHLNWHRTVRALERARKAKASGRALRSSQK